MENNSTPPMPSSALLREGMHSIPNPLASLKKGLVVVARTVGALTALALAACTAVSPLANAQDDSFAQGNGESHGRPVKVMIISMFGPEGQVWLDKLGPWQDIPVAGLSPDYPNIHCNRQDICVMTTGTGHANTAASTMALAFSSRSICGTHISWWRALRVSIRFKVRSALPWVNTLSTSAFNGKSTDAKFHRAGTPAISASIRKALRRSRHSTTRTEVFQLNPRLPGGFCAVAECLLSDNAWAQATRAKYNYAPANRAPTVIQCDTLKRYVWSGTKLGERARDWTKILTDGKGVYCTTQQEDNSTYEALKRAASVHRVDLNRVAVLRAGSDFDRPYDGQTSADNLLNYARQRWLHYRA